MRKVLLAAIFAATLLATVPAFAQSPNFDPGPVWRVTYYHIKSGQADAFWKDFRENTKPIFEESRFDCGLQDLYESGDGSSERLERRVIRFLPELWSARPTGCQSGHHRQQALWVEGRSARSCKEAR